MSILLLKNKAKVDDIMMLVVSEKTMVEQKGWSRKRQRVFQILISSGHEITSRGAGTYGDMGTCPNHILEKSLENVLFLNIVATKF